MDRLYYSNDSGHYCRGAALGNYMMPLTWIDTDNRVWSEPYHLYGDARLGDTLQAAIQWPKK